MGEAIVTDRLTKYYGKSRGIIDVDLRVEEGEIFGFVGPNGAGKTTTIRILLNLIYPTRGEARIFGIPISAGAKKLYEQVGYLPGEVNFYPEMTGQEVLDYAARFYPNVKQSWVDSLVERLDFDPSKKVRSYSQGNRKKLGIIQALLHKPRLAVLDEPTAGLDPLIKQRFFQLIEELNAEGTTVFFSTHVLEEVERICHRVGMIKEGRLVQVAPTDQIPGREMKIITFKPAGEKLPEELLKEWKKIEPVEGKPGYYQAVTQEPANRIVTRLAKVDLDDLRITVPSIEDVFLAIYGERNEGGLSNQ